MIQQLSGNIRIMNLLESGSIAILEAIACKRWGQHRIISDSENGRMVWNLPLPVLLEHLWHVLDRHFYFNVMVKWRMGTHLQLHSPISLQPSLVATGESSSSRRNFCAFDCFSHFRANYRNSYLYRLYRHI